MWRVATMILELGHRAGALAWESTYESIAHIFVAANSLVRNGNKLLNRVAAGRS
jgi:hypothetical protein